MPDVSVRLQVEIETPSGLFYRVNDAETVSVTTDILPIENGILTYPDRRVKRFRLYVSEDGSTWKTKAWEAKPAEKTNVAYAVLDAASGSSHVHYNAFTDTDVSTATIDAIRSVPYSDPNQILVSETYSPRSLFGRKSQVAGNSSDDAVLTFCVNAMPVSDGQYGQFPLFVWCRRGLWAMEVGSDGIAFTRVAAFSMNEELVSKHAILNIDNSIVFLTKQGLKALTPEGIKIISDDLIDQARTSEFSMALSYDVCMGLYYDRSNGRKEVWIGTRSGIFAYSLVYGVWFKVSSVRSSFISAYGRLYGCDGANIYWENGNNPLIGSFRTAPIHLGLPHTTKRFYKPYVRYLTVDVVEPSFTGNALVVEKSLVTEQVQSINFDFETRYEHRRHLHTATALPIAPLPDQFTEVTVLDGTEVVSFTDTNPVEVLPVVEAPPEDEILWNEVPADETPPE